jgi:hypothetical protein
VLAASGAAVTVEESVAYEFSCRTACSNRRSAVAQQGHLEVVEPKEWVCEVRGKVTKAPRSGELSRNSSPLRGRCRRMTR